MGNEKILQEVLDRMVPKKRRYAIECPKCGTFVAPDPEEHAWGYMDYHCESCNYQWSIRRSRDA